MALPITEYPLIDIYVYSKKENYQFRPFLVKEEKLLVMASETNEILDMVKATQQIITNCSFGKIEGDKIPIFDMQNIFMQLRKSSIGSDIDAKFSCGHCGEKQSVVIDLNNFKLVEHDAHDKTVKVSDTLTVEMRYPAASELKEIAGTNEHAEIYSAAAACMEKIYVNDSVYEGDEVSIEDKLEFIENMTTDQFGKIRQFYETMPVLENKIEFTCKACGKENYTFMNGYFDFFA